MYRTDKQFMTNPATASSRIYIGGLAKTIVASDLEEKFKAHGKILGLVLQMGFAFVQFENEAQAQVAIKNENGAMLHGRKITVKQALDKSQKGNNPNQNQRGPNNMNQNQNRRPGQGPYNQGPRPGQGQGQGPHQHGQGQGPQHHGQGQGPQNSNQGQGPHHPDQRQGPQHAGQGQGPQHQGQGPQHTGQGPQHPGQRQGPQHPSEGQRPQHPGQGEGPNQGQNQGPPPSPKVQNNAPIHNETPPTSQPQPAEEPPKFAQKPEPEKELPATGPPNLGPKNIPSLMEDSKKNDAPPEKRPRKRRMRSRDRFQQPADMYRDEPYYGRDEYPPASGNYGGRPPVIDQPDRNDCEIIVVSKLLTKYAEYIEQRLKGLGLIVDLLFPNEDVPIGRVLANISSRGCLYAILVMPQNEEHRSLTLNILHGIPQEHRNMPTEDALILITRNFDAYMRGDKTTVETLGPGGVLSVSDRHPTSMQLLLNLLAENRQLTSVQYDRLLKYLQERREVQQKHEVEEGVDQTSQESNTKQAELQSRIMNILNKAADNPPPPEVPEPAEVAPPLLKDPSVQKALDSLLGGEMFKSINVM